MRQLVLVENWVHLIMTPQNYWKNMNWNSGTEACTWKAYKRTEGQFVETKLKLKLRSHETKRNEDERHIEISRPIYIMHGQVLNIIFTHHQRSLGENGNFFGCSMKIKRKRYFLSLLQVLSFLIVLVLISYCILILTLNIIFHQVIDVESMDKIF